MQAHTHTHGVRIMCIITTCSMEEMNPYYESDSGPIVITGHTAIILGKERIIMRFFSSDNLVFAHDHATIVLKTTGDVFDNIIILMDYYSN